MTHSKKSVYKIIEKSQIPLHRTTKHLSKYQKFITMSAPTPCNTPYIHPPQFLIEPIKRNVITLGTPQYQLIYIILQDRHVAEQRKFYDLYKDKSSDFWGWNDLPLDKIQKVFMLVLKERFDKNLMKDWEKNWFEGFKSYLNKYHPICTICGIPSIGEMCGEEKKDAPYLQFPIPWEDDTPYLCME